MTRLTLWVQCVVVTLLFTHPSVNGAGEQGNARMNIIVSNSSDLSKAPLDGRMLLMLSTDDAKEPRFQINDGHAKLGNIVFNDPNLHFSSMLDSTGFANIGSAFLRDFIVTLDHKNGLIRIKKG